MADATVTVIVLSYNRPRMLREALSSIRGADEILLLDDGSNFDVRALVREKPPDCRISIRIAPPLGVEEPLVTPRVSRAINQAVRDASGSVIAYLCDDDLFYPSWPATLREYFGSASPDAHFVAGGWGLFTDGEPPGNKPWPAPGCGLTTGNFAHRKRCSIEHGCWWVESSIAIHDGPFLFHRVAPVHPLAGIPRLPPEAQAGWRREHPWNMFNFTGHAGYRPEARDVLARRALE